ncbi:MAG TPA: TRAP transporter substrate-binding protein [Usitatibacter sp.]|jgi:TRAP-type mannitol/chloroaromatic compound transport system substrate-binding protein|nr:TRAP transporter substrate-binding protein [Usitatibacter sp.]
MKRRKFVATAGAGMAGILASATPPAFAQAPAEVKWRLASSFPKSLDTIFAVAEVMSKRIASLTDNRFQVQVFAAGEIVPGLQVADAVQNGTVQCGHTASYYYTGKDPTFALGCAVPFAMNARQFNAWWYTGGGDALFNEFLGEYNIHSILAGNTGAQMGGWYRKEVKTVADLKGLKLRIAGLAGQVLAKLGVVPQQIAGGEIYPALEKGTIDAAEWVGPFDDEKLGLGKIARYYYYPAWWEGGPALHLYVNKKSWSDLPKGYQSALEVAAHEANTLMLSRYDAGNPAALKRLVASGVQLRPYPRPIMDACYAAAMEFYGELYKANAKFKRIHEHQMKFMEDEILWFRVCEANYDNYMQTGRKKG